MADMRLWRTPLPASPARGEVLTEVVERYVFQKLDRNTSPLAGEAGRGVRHNKKGPATGEPPYVISPAITPHVRAGPAR